MRIALTGASGYIGSALNAKLLQHGHEVLQCDLGWFGDKYLGAFQDADFSNVETVIHLAGHSSVLMSENDQNGAWRNNVVGFKSLVDSLGPNQRLIYASSGSVYGNIGSPAKEVDAGLNVLKTYDMTKVIGDVIASNAIVQGKKLVGLRFGTVNGISPNTRIDLMLNSMSFSAVKNSYIDVKNPTISRPILLLDDLLQGVLSVLDSATSGIFNLSSQNVTVEQVAELIVKETGCGIRYHENDLHPYDFHLNCDLFESTFGSIATTTMEKTVDQLLRNVTSVRVGKRDHAGS